MASPFSDRHSTDAALVAAARDALGLTTIQLADALLLNRATVFRWLARTSRIRDRSTRARLERIAAGTETLTRALTA